MKMTACMDKKVINKFRNTLSEKTKDRTIGLELEFSNGDKEKIDLPNGYKHTEHKFSKHFNTNCKEIKNNGRYGGEINTKPIRLNDFDINELEVLFNSIWKAGGVLNWYIDTHIHIYIKDLPIKDILKINDGIYLFGNIMRSVFKIGPWNDTAYAVPLMKKETHEKVSRCKSIEEIARVFRNGSQRGFFRPYISMAQIEIIGTMEYRQFGGTTDFSEIWEQIKFSYRFLEYCINTTYEEKRKIKTQKDFVKTFKIDLNKIPTQLQPFIYAADHKDNMTNVGEMFNKSKPMFSAIKKAVGKKKVLLYNSFNFDIEQALSETNITVYSNNAYVHFLYKIINENITFEFPKEFDFLKFNPQSTKAEKLAKLLFFLEIEKKYNQKTYYADRIYKNTINKLDTIIQKMTDKAAKIVENLENRVTVKYGNFNDMVEAQKDEVIIYQLEEVSSLRSNHNKMARFFDFEIERKENDYSLITEFKNYIFVSRNNFLPYHKIYSDGRNFIYSDLTKKSIFKLDSREVKPLYYKEIPDNHEITNKSKIKYIKATIGEVDYIREKYLSKNIIPGSAPFCYLWFVDDYLIGACLLDFPKRKIDGECAWLKSDFVIDSKIQKLSKLLILAILSKEFQQEITVRFKAKVTHFLTNVFTDKPVSMKYRGVFKLHERESGKLVYLGEAGKFNRLNVEVLQNYLKRLK